MFNNQDKLEAENSPIALKNSIDPFFDNNYLVTKSLKNSILLYYIIK